MISFNSIKATIAMIEDHKDIFEQIHLKEL